MRRVLTDYNKDLLRETDKDGIIFFFGEGMSDDGNDQIYIY